MRRLISLLGAVVLVLAGRSAGAQQTCDQPDFLTSGGYIFRTPPENSTGTAHGNFAVAGACRTGGDGKGLFGHLEYSDDSAGLTAHGTTITAYMLGDNGSADPSSGQPTGTRLICGTATTNKFGNVNWVAKAKDAGEPGTNDQFQIQMSQLMSGTETVVYTTFGDSNHNLAGGAGGGGNIQLHKPGVLVQNQISCPALAAGTVQCAPGETFQPPCGCCDQLCFVHPTPRCASE